MTEPTVVAADHPSLDDQVAEFVTALREEPRFFGPKARTNPKPFASLRSELGRRDGFRLAAMIDGRIVGLVRVSDAGHVHIAVVAEHRGEGIGAALLGSAVDRAGHLRYGRLSLRSSRRSRAVNRLGDRLGCTTFELERGHVEMILPVPAFDAASA